MFAICKCPAAEMLSSFGEDGPGTWRMAHVLL